MAIYFGSHGKVKININGIAYYFNLPPITPSIGSTGLLSSDNYILQDVNGVYLIPSDYIGPTADDILLSLDGYILQDLNGIYLTIKESE